MEMEREFDGWRGRESLMGGEGESLMGGEGERV